MTDYKEVEFAARQYEVVTEHLCEVLGKYEEIPLRIKAALIFLADAINQEWAVGA